jgi:hypothetical protein
MVQTIAVTDAITNLEVAHQRLGLSRTRDRAFFPEWQESLPLLTAAEKAALDKYVEAERYIEIAIENDA